MEYEYILTPDGELYHWGIKGMKWGQRRYQNKDGSLTPAGKKRYAKEEAALKEREKTIKNREREAARRAKMDAKKADLDAREQALNGGETTPIHPRRGIGRKNKVSEQQPRAMKDMSDDEIREITARMKLETDYVNAQKNLAAATPKQVSAGKKFMDAYGDKLLESIVVEPSKKYINKILEKKLGLEDKDPLAKLERKWKEADYKKKIAEAERDTAKAKNPPEEKIDWDSKNKQLTYEETLRKRERELEDAPNRAYEAETERIKRETARINAELANREAQNKQRTAEQREREQQAKDWLEQTKEWEIEQSGGSRAAGEAYARNNIDWDADLDEMWAAFDRLNRGED